MNQLITEKYAEVKNHGSVIFSSVGTLTARPRRCAVNSSSTAATQSADQPVPLPVKQFKLLSKDIHASTPAGTDIDTEVLSYISAAHTYVGREGLAFWNSTSTIQHFHH